MKDKVYVVACEGQHDISFISRILYAAGFTTDNRKIKDFPIPFGALFSNIASKMVLSDRKLGYQSPNFLLPSVALQYQEKMIFLHNLNGDGRSSEREEIIKFYSDLIGEDDFSKDLNYEFRFLFFFDADNHGVKSRLKELTREFDIERGLINGLVVSYGNNELGCYIYHENDSDIGVLEDILLGHFSGKDNDLLGNISGFLDRHRLDDERTKELHVINGLEKRKGSSKYSEKKSAVSLFGQLQFSGMNNSVIISKSDFLTIEDINTCPQCIIIKNMFC